MKINSGIILRIVWQLWDKKDRGATDKQIKFILPLYEKYNEINKGTPAHNPGQIHIDICAELKQKDKNYFK
jgi:hypothetical protein